MNKEQLETLESMTANNSHGLARIYIAKHFKYLKKYEDILQEINKIHELEGSMPHNLSVYRSEITEQMLEMIENKEGYNMARAIAKTL